MVNDMTTLAHYKANVDMLYNKLMSLTDIYELMPFEREVYITLWNEKVKEQNNKGNKNNGYG